MPYIKKEKRTKYDVLIDNLACILNTRENNDELAGEMNYVIFRLARILCDPKSGGKRGYARIAVILSAIGEAEKEFRRRSLVPYEEEKEMENGDVTTNASLDKPSFVITYDKFLQLLSKMDANPDHLRDLLES